MLVDISVAVIVAASFVIGSLLYYLAKEEVDSFKQKFFNYKFLKVKNLVFLPAGIFGIILALATKTPYFEITSLLLFASGLKVGSFGVAEKSIKQTLKYAAGTAIIFLIFFAAFYFILPFLY